MAEIDKKVGVLIIIKGLDFGGKSGGNDKFGFELCMALKNIGSKSALCIYNRFGSVPEGKAVSTLESQGIPFLFLEGKSPFKKLFNRQVHVFCKKHHLTIAHSHFQVGSLLALILKWWKTTPQIIRTAHIYREWGAGWVPALFRIVFTRWLFPYLFDAQVGVSQAIVDQVNNYKSTQKAGRKARVIYNGIPKVWFDETDKNHIKAEDPKHLIGGIGLLVPRKGFEHLILALPKIIDVYPDSGILIVGDGPDRSRLEKIAHEHGLKKNIIFVGQQIDMRSWFEKMGLFLLPSLIEGLPTVILESMASHIPVIATDIQGTRELVLDEKTGWLVPVKDSDAIADTVIHAFSHPTEVKTVVENAYHWARQFTIETAAQQYYELYKELIIGGIKIGD